MQGLVYVTQAMLKTIGDLHKGILVRRKFLKQALDQAQSIVSFVTDAPQEETASAT
jgi:hypothetical protein